MDIVDGLRGVALWDWLTDAFSEGEKMKYKYLFISIIIALAIASPVSGLFDSESYIIPKDTISAGGSYSMSSNYSMTATIGQTSCIGRSSRGSLVIHAGFWTPEYFDLRSKALPFIPLLLLDE